SSFFVISTITLYQIEDYSLYFFVYLSNNYFTLRYTNHAKAEYLYFKVSKNKEIQETIDRIMWELYKPSTMSEATIKLLVGLLLIELAKKTDSIEGYSANDYEKKLVLDTLNYIDTNYKTATLYEISNRLRQPHYKLSRIIKKYTELTFNELLQEKRLSKAAELLKSTNLPISETIQSIGYENLTYFYKIFKKKYNTTPKKYRDTTD
ncbi:helix-turn-helix domain-containing protein, partial [Clostridium sp. Cult1]|uniref:helix-turn-helix domain-containing protein n=1 Tax=Clostridium sp. Cult1 TaxID=2079002 RepID=UPI001F1ADD31